MAIQSSNPFEVLIVEQWQGLNQQSPRGSIGDQEEFWNENFFAVGPGNLRTMWGLGPLVYTAPAGATILRMFFGFYGHLTPQHGAPPPGAMGWMFLSDGTIDEVDLDTHTTTGLRAAGSARGGIWTPIAPQYWASAKVWRPTFVGATGGQQGGVLFGSPKGLWAWDGATLSGPGDPAPDWLTEAAETGTGPFTMPVGLPGIYTMEVYQSRLWVAGKNVISFSAPSNGADFSTIDGGGSFGYFGDKLVYSFMDLHAVAGYMFIFGDSSTDLISNVKLTGAGTTGSPFTTIFNYENIDPQVGQRFPRPIGPIGRYSVLFNKAGIFLMQGGDAQQIGDKITNIWNTLDTSLYLPTFAPATIFGFRVMLINGRFTDVTSGRVRNLILIYHPTRGHEFWSVASQGIELTNIGSYEQDSSIRPYGTDGTKLYQLFAQPDPNLLKQVQLKNLRGDGIARLTIKNFKRLFLEVNDNAGQGVNFIGQVASGEGGVPGGLGDIFFELQPGLQRAIIPYPLEGAGLWMSVSVSTTCPDATLERIYLGYEERTLFGA